MNYQQALEYIHGTRKLGWKLGLNNIRYLLDLMGNPHKKLKFIHIAGTNGKGSTAAFISSILTEAGYRVGTFTSPYLEHFTERIKVNNIEITKDELAHITAFVKENIDKMVRNGHNHPTEFEIVTSIGFMYFYMKKCDLVVLEVGLGGRFDATNVIDTPLVSVITTINYDHMNILGNTLEEIAFEKAGIIKKQSDVVLYPQPENVLNIFRNICEQKKAHLHEVDFSGLNLTNFNIDGQFFDYNDLKSLHIALIGKHQLKNAVVALKTISVLESKGYYIAEDAVRKGLKNARWSGRFQVVCRNPLFVVDGAHNIEGAKSLRIALEDYFYNKGKILILGVLKDKDYKSIVKNLIPVADKIITVTPSTERALPAGELADFIKPYCKDVSISDTIEGAVKTSLNICTPKDIICACGSLYYIGEVIEIFKNNGK